MTMKAPKPDDLIAYLYDEVDEPTREAVDEHLDRCDETRDQLDRWRSTMHALDHWVVEEPASTACYSWWRLKAAPVLRLAAVITALLGLGFILGAQWRKLDSPDLQLAETDPKTSPTEQWLSEKEIESRVAERLAEERLAMAEQHDEIAKNLILASGSMTHRQVQNYVGQALQHLETHGLRNQTLSMFLPPDEQEAYQRKSAALKSLATRVDRESQRQEQFTRQIIERARARHLRAH